MSAKQVTAALQQLLTGKGHPLIISITGEWGTGKTHFWKQYTEHESHERSLYVSLFGVSSVREVRQQLSIASLPTRLESQKKHFRPLLDVIDKLKYKGVGIPADLLTSIYLYHELKQVKVVCFDDLERSGIDHAEFLGYASNLRDENNVSVVLILNSQALKEANTWNTYHEKVIDRELPFRPTIPEILRISEMPPETQERAASTCEAMGLTNIRVIRRALQYCKEVCAAMEDQAACEALGDQLVQSLLVFCHAKYTPDSQVGPLEALRNFDLIGSELLAELQSSKSSGASSTTTQSESAVEANALRTKATVLRRAGYTATDSLDRVLLDFVSSGVLDQSTLQEALMLRSQGRLKAATADALQQTWELFHGSLRDNETEFLEALERTFENHIDHLGTNDVCSIVSVLDRLGHVDRAEAMRQRYVDKHSASLASWKVADEEAVPDHAMRVMIRAVIDGAQYDSRDFESVIADAESHRLISVDDLRRLAEFSTPEMVAGLRNLSGRNRVAIAKRLALGEFPVAAQPEMAEPIRMRLTEAFRTIASESNINRVRLSRIVNINDD